MEKVRVIAAQGITLRGAWKIKLSASQLARRPELPASKTGIVKLDGKHSVTLKFGEVFQVDGLDKLSRAMVEPVDADPVDAEPVEPAAGDAADGGSEDDLLTGADGSEAGDAD